MAASAGLVQASLAAIADLEARLPLGMGPLEVALAARLRAAIAQLLACAEELAAAELMICGSTGQKRPHPLLKTLADLRREISDGLKELTFRVDQRAQLARMNAAIEERRRATRGKQE
jgi:hypothetical protein